MNEQVTIELLVDGTLTWVSRSGKTERAFAMRRGDTLQVAVVEEDGSFNFIDDGWTAFGIAPDKFRIVE